MPIQSTTCPISGPDAAPSGSSGPETAVLLVNLGTPAAPTTAAVGRYLAQFLADRRVVELPRWLWLPILYGIIVPFRSGKVAHAYRSIWTGQGSPLLVNTRALADSLQGELGSSATVAFAMRYGEPAIGRVLEGLAGRDGLRRLLVVPLYPQYSATTTASVLDAIGRELRAWRRVPELRWIADYHAEAGWLDAVAASIRRHWQEHGRGDRLLFSFHGIPQACVDAGDPYLRQCQAGAAAIAGRLGLTADQWQLSFQSRVGRAEWLRPYTDQILPELAAAGVRRLDVVSPGFAVDCLETLEEIVGQYGELFVSSGGEALRYIPALNAEPAHAQALAGLVRRHAADWLAAADGTDR